MEDEFNAWPARPMQQEEEEAAAPLESQPGLPPLVVIKNLAGTLEGGLRPYIVVIATSKGAWEMLIRSTKGIKVAGAMLPTNAPISKITLTPSPSQPMPYIYTTSESQDVLLIPSFSGIPPNRSAQYAKGLLQHISPRHAIILSDAKEHGLGDSTEHETPVFSLQTGGAKADPSLRPGVPHLPSGNVVDALPAALMSYCEVRKMAATTFVNLESTAQGMPGLVAERHYKLQVTEAAKLLGLLGCGGVLDSSSCGGVKVSPSALATSTPALYT